MIFLQNVFNEYSKIMFWNKLLVINISINIIENKYYFFSMYSLKKYII